MVVSLMSVEENVGDVDSWRVYETAPTELFQLKVGLSDTLAALSGGEVATGTDGNAISQSGRCHTPLLKVPAKRLVPKMARDQGKALINPEFTEVQVRPLSVVTKIPLLVPAKRLVPLRAKEVTKVFFKPELEAVQLLPLLVEEKTPP